MFEFKVHFQEKGQAAIETALVLGVILTIVMGIIYFSMMFIDYVQIQTSASKAIRVAQRFVIKSNNISCESKALAAANADGIGFTTLENTRFDITNCPSDPSKLPTDDVPIIATWTIDWNPPIPFLTGRIGFSDKEITIEGFYAR